MNCRIGVMYCITPMTDRGSLVAAAPKAMSGIAVTGPSRTSRVVVDQSVWPNVAVPAACAAITMASATGSSTVVSTVRLPSALMSARFLNRP